MRANNLTYEHIAGSNIFIVRELGKPTIKTDTKVYYLKYARVSGSPLEEEEEETGIKASVEKILTKH